MANSSDEEFSSDSDSIDLSPLWRDSPFQSDPPTEENKAETTLDPVNDAGPPIVLELTPITAAQDDSTDSADTSTTSADLGARYELSGQFDIPLTPFGTRWMPAASSSFYGHPAGPEPVQNVVARRRYRRRLTDQIPTVDVSALPMNSNDEVMEDKEPINYPRYVLPGAIREREEREDAQIDEATRRARAFRSKFVSKLLASQTNRNSRTDSKRLPGRFGTKNK